MPFTAFHSVPAWLLWKKWPRRFDFVSLTVGAAIPDLFEPLVFLHVLDPQSDIVRDWTHSLIGAFTLDAILALAATTFVVRPLLVRGNRVWPSGLWSRFAGREFLGRKSGRVIVVSVWLGTISHVLLDVPFHAMLRLFYPAPGVPLYPPNLDFWAHIAADFVLGPVFLYLLYLHWWRPSRGTRGTNPRIGTN